MDKKDSKLTFKFMPGLKANYVGIPSEYGRRLLNLINAQTTHEFLQKPSETPTEFESRDFNWKLNDFMIESRFRVYGIEKNPDFYGFITPDAVEISDIYKDELRDETPVIRPVYNQGGSTHRWEIIKSKIDTFDADFYTNKILSRLSERDAEIVMQAYGINQDSVSSVSTIATDKKLTRQRIYQIISSAKRPLSRRRRTLEDPDFNWFRDLGEIAVKNRMGLSPILYVMELEFEGKFKLLKDFYPFLMDANNFSKFIYPKEDRYSHPAIKKLDGVSVDALPLPLMAIDALKAANILDASQLASISEGDLMRIPNLTRKALEEIKGFLSLYK